MPDIPQVSQSPQWSTSILLSIFSIIALLVGDRVFMAVQLENNRTRVMALEEINKTQNELLEYLRQRQIENSANISLMKEQLQELKSNGRR